MRLTRATYSGSENDLAQASFATVKSDLRSSRPHGPTRAWNDAHVRQHVPFFWSLRDRLLRPLEVARIRILTALRGLHTLIYAAMALSTIALLCIALTGHFLFALWVIGPLLMIEIVVFTVSGSKCPLTALVDHYAGPAGPDAVARNPLPRPTPRRHLVAFLGRSVVGNAGWRVHLLAGPYRDLGKITP